MDHSLYLHGKTQAASLMVLRLQGPDGGQCWDGNSDIVKKIGKLLVHLVISVAQISVEKLVGEFGQGNEQ